MDRVNRYNASETKNTKMKKERKAEKVPLLGNVYDQTYASDTGNISLGKGKPDSYHYAATAHDVEIAISKRKKRRDMSISFNEVLEPITLTWQNVNVYAPLPSTGWRKRRDDPQHKQILYDVSGVVQPGSLLAILGASGAGKTTLLNVLTYRNRGSLVVDGDVRVNGGRIGKGMPSMSAYIQQEDLFIGTLTVSEHLWFQSQLRMDKDVPNEIRRMRVEKVMKEMSLTKCKDVVIGIPGKLKGISGGEKKRLTFASEVLTNPPLLFCDEPTSGLDSYMARNIVTTMKLMASKGRTILCTIHQPSSEVFALFDRVLLVAEGRTAYLGPAKQALNFFEERGYPCPVNYNPADHYVLTLAVVPGEEQSCRERVKGICDNYEKSAFGEAVNQNIKEAIIMEDGIMYDEEAFPNKSPYKSSWLKQFLPVLWRSWISVKREPGVFNTRIVQSLILSTLFGLVYFGQNLDQAGVQNINGALFLMINQMTFGFVFAVIHAFPPEFPVFLREHHDGMYRVDVYFLAKTIAEMPQFVIIPFIFTTVMYWLVGFYPDFWTYVLCVIVLFLVCNVAISLGYCLSSCSSNPSFVLALGPIFVVPVMAIGGFFIKTSSIPTAFLWLKYVSWFTYSNELLVVNQWRNIGNISCIEDVYINGTLQTKGEATCFRTGKDVIRSQGFDDSEGEIVFDFLMLVVLLVTFRIVAFLFLFARSRRQYKTSKPRSK